MIIDLNSTKFKLKEKNKTLYFCSKNCYEKYTGREETQLTLKIKGMHCASCVTKIENNIKKIKGIKKANVNLLTEKAQIVYNSNLVNKTQILKSVKDTGYEPIEHQISTQNSKQEEITLKIHGMMSQHCINIVETTLKNLYGIIEAKANLTTEKAEIKYDTSKITLKEIVDAINNAGYEAEKTETKDIEKEERQKEIKILKTKFFISLILSMPLVYMVMGSFVGLPSIELPIKFLALIQLVLATPVVIVGHQFFSRGFRALIINRIPNSDSLIALGVGAAYIYSLTLNIAIFFGSNKYSIHDLYYETAAFLITFILLGRLLEAIAKGKTSEAIKKLIGLQPKTARVIRNGKEQEIRIDEVNVGDIIIVKPGQKIPVDGIIIEGHSYIDESMVTGESIPVEKKKGSAIIGATINKTGSFKFKATKVGKDTFLAQIIKLVEEAQSSKAPIQEMADKIASYFVPIVLTLAIISAITWYLIGAGSIFSLTILIAVLVIACPCAIGLAAPTAIMVGTGKGAEQGILIKSAEALQKTYEIDIIIFDKTGTLTKGEPVVTDIKSDDPKNLIKFAAIVEKGSEHPLADAVLKKAEEMKIKIPDADKFEAIPGHGIKGVYGKNKIEIGNRKMMEKSKVDIKHLEKEMEMLEQEGKTVMVVAVNKQLIGLIAIADTLKETSKETVEQLSSLGIETIMLTGDNEKTAMVIAKNIGIKNVIANVLPGEKAKVIKKLQSKGKIVAMVGDGINDAPALAQANIGIAIGSGSDVAKETGGIILVKDNLLDVVAGIKLSKATMKKIKQNLFWAFAYNAAAIPIAAFGLLNPIIAAAAMALSSLTVVGNSALLKRYKIKDE